MENTLGSWKPSARGQTVIKHVITHFTTGCEMSFTHVPVFVDQPQGPFPLIPKVHKLNDLHVRSYAQAGAGLVLVR